LSIVIKLLRNAFYGYKILNVGDNRDELKHNLKKKPYSLKRS